MEIIFFLSIVIAVVAVLTSIVLIRRVKKQIAEMTDALVDVKNGNGNRRILSATNELAAPLAYEINEIVVAYESRLSTVRQTEETNRQLMTSLSHDVRTPLTTLIGYLDAAHKGLVTGKDRDDYIETARRKAHDLKEYVRNSNLCTTHAISYEALQQIVMSDIQKHIKNMEALGDQFIQEMHELSEKGGSKKIKQFEKDLEVTEKRIAEIDNVIMKLFEQNALGKISDERFEKMSSAYESEQKELAQKRDELRTKIRAEEKKTQSTNQFLETIRKYETVTELNRSMLVELIDSIYVYQAEGTGRDRKQRVEINYRFLAGSQCGIA